MVGKIFSRKNRYAPPKDHHAIILSGGGARGAYQAGVLKALSELIGEDAAWPFDVIAGTSCGAVNAAFLAGHQGTFAEATSDLWALWQRLEVDDIYDAGTFDVVKGLASLGWSLFNGGVGQKHPVSIFNTSPLKRLIEREINFEGIQANIDSGRLRSLSITAMGYSTGESVSFFQGVEEIDSWQRFRRMGVRTELQPIHLLASTAIPSVFPAVQIGREYFGDGAMRQYAPLSPALNTGATKLFVVGVSSNKNPRGVRRKEPIYHSPSMAQIVGHLFSSTFIDGLEGDLERMNTINDLLLKLHGDERKAVEDRLKPVANFCVSPSTQIDRMAARHVDSLPTSMRLCFWATGATARGGGAAAASYLLFEHGFISELLELGYKDTMWDSDAIVDFMTTGAYEQAKDEDAGDE